ncbi:tRNA lysidine(34) synthetase TilS [Carnobacterium sp.]|uniref:tRNA lysidine(34) synthetase TilS n=1 Tax=Carnobacterium sp. TaxID=48221 RepID=UPI003C788294
MDLVFDFTQNCKRHLLWKPSDRILIAVSSGVDSMVLLDLIQHLPDSLRPWYGVLHVNHELRSSSIEEERFLENLCYLKKIPYFSRSWKKEEHPEKGIELAARNFRYTFFEEMMELNKATHLLTAHHADDQLETVLMRLVRGGQIDGMVGIKDQRKFGPGVLVRPLLHYSKEDIYAYSKIHQLAYYEDETNSDPMYTRNRYRQRIVPLLKLENDQVLTHFKDFSSDLSDILSITNKVIQEKSELVLVESSSVFYEIDKTTLLSLEPGLQRQVLKYILLNKVYKFQPVETLRKQVEELVGLMTSSKSNAQLDLPKGWKARRQYQQLFLEKTNPEKVKTTCSQKKLFPEQWVFLEDGARVGLFKRDAHVISPYEKDKHIWINPNQVVMPLVIRHRKKGDRMTLKGMQTGRKKIKDILIDQKIPIKMRDEVSVLTDSLGEIIWLLNYKESRLSIPRETDKIQYILVYQE